MSLRVTYPWNTHLELFGRDSAFLATPSWKKYSQIFPSLTGIIQNTIVVTVARSRNPILNWVLKLNHLFENVWSFKANLSHAFVTKKLLKQWNLGIKGCSNWYNYFMVFMRLGCYFPSKYQNNVWYIFTLAAFSQCQCATIVDVLSTNFFLQQNKIKINFWKHDSF